MLKPLFSILNRLCLCFQYKGPHGQLLLINSQLYFGCQALEQCFSSTGTSPGVTGPTKVFSGTRKICKIKDVTNFIDLDLKIRRLQLENTTSEIVLKRLEDENKSPTEIEESLDSLQFYTALSIIIEQKNEFEIIGNRYP